MSTSNSMLQPQPLQHQQQQHFTTHQMVPTQTGMSFSYTPNAGYTINQVPIQPQQQQQQMMHNHVVNSYDIYHQQQQQQQQMYMLQQQQRYQQQQMYRQPQQLQYPSGQQPIAVMAQPQLPLPSPPPFLSSDSSNSSTTTPSLYNSPNSSPNTIQQEISPNQSPKSEPGTPETGNKRPKLRVTIPTKENEAAAVEEQVEAGGAEEKEEEKSDTASINNKQDEPTLSYPYSSLPPPSALPSQFVQNLPSPSTFYPEFYQSNFIMSPIHSTSTPATATANSANNPFLIPTSPFRESGIRTLSETNAIR